MVNKYRGLEFEIKGDFVHFYNPKGVQRAPDYAGNMSTYRNGRLIRSIPERCKLGAIEFAKTVIDNLYVRMETYQKEENRLYFVSKSNRFLKNMCK